MKDYICPKHLKEFYEDEWEDTGLLSSCGDGYLEGFIRYNWVYNGKGKYDVNIIWNY